MRAKKSPSWSNGLRGDIVVKRIGLLWGALVIEYVIYDGSICLVYLVAIETDVYIYGCFTYTKWRF